MNREKIFLGLLCAAYVLAMLALIADLQTVSTGSGTSFFLALILESVAVLDVAVAMNLRWPADHTKVLSGGFIGFALFICMVEINSLQDLFTRQFLIGQFIFCIAITLISLILIFLLPKDIPECDHEGCSESNPEMLTECFVEDLVTGEKFEFLYCSEHAYENGFCPSCGEFWGGIESFDFNNPSELCANCLDQIESEVIYDYAEAEYLY